MDWQLSDDVSYCRLDDRLVFLDVDKDRYFQLSEALEHSFIDFVSGAHLASTSLDELAKLGIICAETNPSRDAPFVELPRPSQSALEIQHDARLSTSTARDVFVSVIAMAIRLRRHRLKDVLNALIQLRAERIPALTYELDPSCIERRVVVASAAFNRIRPYVPVTPRCLIDSLSLVEFLAKRGLPARLVIAVACDPFSAHAWVQYGDFVLNDTIGNAWNHVPIRVI